MDSQTARSAAATAENIAAKSKHVSKACMQCRARKSKCNKGERPCQNCITHRSDCTDSKDPDRRKTRAHVDALRKFRTRIEQLEAYIKENGLLVPAPQGDAEPAEDSLDATVEMPVALGGGSGSMPACYCCSARVPCICVPCLCGRCGQGVQSSGVPIAAFAAYTNASGMFSVASGPNSYTASGSATVGETTFAQRPTTTSQLPTQALGVFPPPQDVAVPLDIQFYWNNAYM